MARSVVTDRHLEIGGTAFNSAGAGYPIPVITGREQEGKPIVSRRWTNGRPKTRPPLPSPAVGPGASDRRAEDAAGPGPGTNHVLPPSRSSTQSAAAAYTPSQLTAVAGHRRSQHSAGPSFYILNPTSLAKLNAFQLLAADVRLYQPDIVVICES